MTVTEPLVTESGLDQVAVEEITIDLTAIDVPTTADDDVEQSLWRDPLVPFLVIGTLSLIAVVLAAFVLSSGTVAL